MDVSRAESSDETAELVCSSEWSRSNRREVASPMPPNQSSWLELIEDNLPCILWSDVAVVCRCTAREDQFHKWRLMTHSDAPDLLHDGGNAETSYKLFEGVVDMVASLGNATRTEAHANLARIGRHHRLFPPGTPWFSILMLEKLVNRTRHLLR